MESSTIIQILIYAITLTICIFGVKQDIDERKFSNKKLAIMIVLGIFSSIILGRVKEALVLFLIVNVIGAFLSTQGVLGAADWKLFSSICLFIPFEDITLSIIYGTSLIVFTVLLKIFYTNKGHVMESFKDELRGLKVLYYTKQFLHQDNSKNVYKSKTTPLSICIVGSFLVTLLFVV